MNDKSDPRMDGGEVPSDELAILHRVDERTERIDSRLDEVAESVEGNTNDIDDLQSKVNRNTTILNGITVGGVAVTTWIADKLTRLFP